MADFFLASGRAWYRWGHPGFPRPEPAAPGHPRPGSSATVGRDGLNAPPFSFPGTGLNAPHFHFHGALLHGNHKAFWGAGRLQRGPRAPCPPSRARGGSAATEPPLPGAASFSHGAGLPAAQLAAVCRHNNVPGGRGGGVNGRLCPGPASPINYAPRSAGAAAGPRLKGRAGAGGWERGPGPAPPHKGRA